eukprot:scaffold229390_cov21-Prasinocladus_malaysianus.AAC.1
MSQAVCSQHTLQIRVAVHHNYTDLRHNGHNRSQCTANLKPQSERFIGPFEDAMGCHVPPLYWVCSHATCPDYAGGLLFSFCSAPRDLS